MNTIEVIKNYFKITIDNKVIYTKSLDSVNYFQDKYNLILID